MKMVSSEKTKASVVALCVEAACDRIAPTWPLDQFIAVNPYWGWRGQSVTDAASHLGALSGTRLTMPRSWYREQWALGAFFLQDVLDAASVAGDPTLADRALDVLQRPEQPEPVFTRMALVSDLLEFRGGPRPGQTWNDLVIHEISQHCGAHFDQWQASWHQGERSDLYTQWRRQQAVVYLVNWKLGKGWARQALASLPTRPIEVIEHILSELRIPDTGFEDYLTSLLVSVNGWAAWCSYRRWQARLVGSDDDEIVALLAIRLTWEWLLRQDTDDAGSPFRWDQWAESWLGVDGLAASLANEQSIDWLLHAAVERSYQNSLICGLTGSFDAVGQSLADGQGLEATIAVAPTVQAVFCIDVRSEVFRRALESVNPDTQTRGFAGFFGLPLAYTPVASSLTRPQLPGLLTPALHVTEQTTDGQGQVLANQRAANLETGQRWSQFRSNPASVFSFVESMGIVYGAKLIKESLPYSTKPAKWEFDGLPGAAVAGLRPQLDLVKDDPAAAAAIANRVLRGMGLIAGFAPLVLLCGHGSQSANNPQAAGLDCGACGGQTGEINARVLSDLLNSSEVRHHLMGLGIAIPDSTWFVAGLHNTTTDEVDLFDTDLVPNGFDANMAELRRSLVGASYKARAERAASLGLSSLAERPEELRKTILERSNDWSQVRPEWGLAGNAAFVVAPRSRTRRLNLGGRSFLHDYDWANDPDLATLTLIMTAPMVVTNWINMQYNASTVDNRRYGSGNKVLHNVVGGHIGVFEGNGGDLRIGLAMQSLHDGARLRHQPLRLSVFIEAPREGIDIVISQHEVVHDLVANAWLYLFRIDPQSGMVEQRSRTGWSTR